jgi:C-terminal processing protease CtpA/Prc
MLHGTKIESTLIGGPSFGLINKGDQIMKIDGKDVTNDSVLEALRGCDIPGSTVIITVQRQYPGIEESGVVVENNSLKMHDGYVDVEVTRMATADIADHQRIFELFTVFKVRFFSGIAGHEMCDVTLQHTNADFRAQ